MGAWPVTGFCGLEILLLYIAFRLNYRSGRAYETVRLTQTDLEIRRFGPRGDEVAHWPFEPTWLRVSMDDPPRHESRLTLSSHGPPLAIGGFLTPEEGLGVALALRPAQHARRTAPPFGPPAGWPTREGRSGGETGAQP